MALMTGLLCLLGAFYLIMALLVAILCVASFVTTFRSWKPRLDHIRYRKVDNMLRLYMRDSLMSHNDVSDVFATNMNYVAIEIKHWIQYSVLDWEFCLIFCII